MKSKDIPIGALIDKLHEIREERRKIAIKDKELEEDFKDLETKITVRLAAEGAEKASSKTATVSLSHTTVATVKDWDALCKWVKRTGHFQLFQRRISDPSFRELLDLKYKEIPGLKAFDKTSLNLRSI